MPMWQSQRAGAKTLPLVDYTFCPNVQSPSIPDELLAISMACAYVLAQFSNPKSLIDLKSRPGESPRTDPKALKSASPPGGYPAKGGSDFLGPGSLAPSTNGTCLFSARDALQK